MTNVVRITNDEELAAAHKEATDLYERMCKLDTLGADVSAEIVSEELHVMLMDLIAVTKLTPEQQRHAINVLREFKKQIDADKQLGADEYKKLEWKVRIYTAAFMHVISEQFYTTHEPTILDEQAAANG